MLKTPILLLIFNRPDVTEKVFEEIRKAEPKYLYVAADGGRAEKSGEKELCEQARNIIKKVDWDCEVKTLFRSENLGLRKAVSEAISWFFNNIEEGIILEDDCLPSQSFFRFCEEMLDRYRNDKKIMHISGNNFQNGIQRGDGSYYFSKIMHCWGWATWKRAWKLYDKDMQKYPEFVDKNLIKTVSKNKAVQEHWINKFQKVYEKELNSWAYVWTYSIYNVKGLCINPNNNLVTNIGFGENATHTQELNNLANKEKTEMADILHPTSFLADVEADKYTYENCYKIIKFKSKLKKNETINEFLKRKKIQKKIDFFAKKYAGQKIIFYGGGKVLDAIINDFDLTCLNIEGIADIKFNNGETYLGYKTFNSYSFIEQNPDIVIITMQESILAENFFENTLIPKLGRFNYEPLIKTGNFDIIKPSGKEERNKTMQATGERFIPEYMTLSRIAYEHWSRYMLASKFTQGKKVLDIACGTGYGSFLLSENSQEVIGMDISTESVDYANQKFIKENLSFKQASAAEIPLPDKSMDVIVSYETIEHVDEETQHKAMKEFARVLKNDGVLIISTPSKDSKKYNAQNPYHIKEYFTSEFIDFVQNYFKHVSYSGQEVGIVCSIFGETPSNPDICFVNTPDLSTNVKPEKSTAIYLVAVCSNEKQVEIPDLMLIDYKYNVN